MSDYIELGSVAEFVSDRIDIERVNKQNYISTENMIENKGGVINAKSLPTSKTVLNYKPEDILVSNIRLYFEKIWFADKEGGCSADVLVLRTAKGYIPKFIYYVLSDSNFFKYADVTSKGTKMPRGDKKAILKYIIPDYPIYYQKKITTILSTYDNLIENNSRRIQILEQTAEELYKEWFVRMRFPGYENTKFDKGIPEGWEVQKLSGLIRVTDGTHDTPKEVTDGVPLVTGRNIINGQIDFNTTYNISKEDHKKINVRSSIEKYDVLYSNIGTIGQMAIVHNDNKYSVKNLIILKTSQYDCYEYIYLHFKNEACQRHFDSIASGASQKFISLTEMRNYKILIPKKETLEQFKIYVSNLFNQIVLLSNQNQNLIKQRDLLLPRLMNGTIIVK